MQLNGEHFPYGGRRQRSNPWRILFMLFLIAGGIWLTRLVEAGDVTRPFTPTATPTRTTFSYQEEAEAHFSAGNLERAITAYQAGVERQPDNSRLWAELSRVQVYSSAVLTDVPRIGRLAEARASIDRAIELNPDDGFAWAVRALAYNWSASGDPANAARHLNEAEISVNRALQIGDLTALAQAFDAEVKVDQQQYAQALDTIELAINNAPRDLVDDAARFGVDVYRVYGSVLESNGLYRQAIEEYTKAIDINPNLTFIYLRIGANYRRLAGSAIGATRSELIDSSLEAFSRAAQINDQLQIADPIPYLAIGRTYLQEGEFFIASRNLERAVSIAPGDASLMGFLGIVYFKARNYEGAQSVLGCAVEGCGPEVGREMLCQRIYGCDPEDEEAQVYGEQVEALPLGPASLEYYYTYGSVLAFNDDCNAAEAVFQELIAGYASDPIVSAIVQEGRAICSGRMLDPQAEPTPTPLPGENT